MRKPRRITVEVPPTLLRRAQQSTGEGITETVRRGLRLVAAGQAYQELRRLRGRIRTSIRLKRLRHDR